MSDKRQIIPVWFFVGVLLLTDGLLILASQARWSHPPTTVGVELHAPVWWGALLMALGGIYSVVFFPKNKRIAHP